jgi:hypothetical protein
VESVLRQAAGQKPEPEAVRPETPPGEFVTYELQTDCSRFLEEIKDVVRRRSEAGLAPKR